MGNELGDWMTNEEICLSNIIPEETPNFGLGRARFGYEVTTDLDVGPVYYIVSTLYSTSKAKYNKTRIFETH